MESSPHAFEELGGPTVMTGSAAFGIAVVLYNLFRWTLVEWLTPFFLPIVDLAMVAVFIGITAWSLIYFLRHRKLIGIRNAFAPLAVNLCIGLIVLLVPFTEITTKFDFRSHYAKRMEIVSSVLSGKMDKFITQKGGRGDLIHLPPEFSGLSAGGNDIMVFRRDGHVLVFFFTYRGILDNFSGFVYSSDDTKPQDGDFGGNFIELEQLRPNWYWAAST